MKGLVSCFTPFHRAVAPGCKGAAPQASIQQAREVDHLRLVKRLAIAAGALLALAAAGGASFKIP